MPNHGSITSSFFSIESIFLPFFKSFFSLLRAPTNRQLISHETEGCVPSTVQQFNSLRVPWALTLANPQIPKHYRISASCRSPIPKLSLQRIPGFRPTNQISGPTPLRARSCANTPSFSFISYNVFGSPHKSRFFIDNQTAGRSGGGCGCGLRREAATVLLSLREISSLFAAFARDRDCQRLRATAGCNSFVSGCAADNRSVLPDLWASLRTGSLPSSPYAVS